MKCPRIRVRRRTALLALAFAPPLLWTLLVLAVPTEWARARLAKRLARASGSPVRLAGVSLGYFGGLTLSDLRFGGKDPWLRVELARVDIGLLHMLVGNGELTEFRVDGFDLRVHRLADGSLECGDPLAADPGPDTTPDDASGGAPTCGLQVVASNGRVRVHDEPTDTLLQIDRVEGHATWEAGIARLEELKGEVNGGTIALAACLDRSTAITRVSGQLVVADVALNRQTDVLSMLIPVRSKRSDGFDGQADLSIYLQAEGPNPRQLRESLRGTGVVELNPIRLDSTGLWAELSDVLGLPAKAKVGSARSDFKVGGGKVSTENLTLEVSGASVVMAGSTDFQGGINYTIRPDNLSSRLPREARQILDEVQGDLSEILTLRVRGTLESPVIEGGPLGSPDDPSRRGQDARLKLIGRKLREKYLR
ncbi:AsmA-like C-terminal region-containing protein [Isosphaeraceae bacterium EP7]